MDAIEVMTIGVVATGLMDLWQWGLRYFLHWPAGSWTLIGRWFGHMPHGPFRHDNVAYARAVRGETALGWTVH